LAKRKDQKHKAEPRPSKSKLADNYAIPSDQERLPVHVPGTYQVAMGTGAEIVNWFREVSGNTQAILIRFPGEESYKAYGPILWDVANKLPKIVARTQRRKFEQLVDALTDLSLAWAGAESANTSGARIAGAKKALRRRRRENTE
jgi:hypothetical protein